MAVAKFRKKPVVIEALQWDGSNFFQIQSFLGLENYLGLNPDGEIYVRTLEGRLVASVGDWIIKGVKGEFYPCKPDIFEATYERVEE